MDNTRLLCLADAATQHISSDASSVVVPRTSNMTTPLPPPCPSLPAATSWDHACLAPFEPRNNVSLPPISSFLAPTPFTSKQVQQQHPAIQHTHDAEILRSFTPSPRMSPATTSSTAASSPLQCGSSGYASPLLLPQPTLRYTCSPRASPIISRRESIIDPMMERASIFNNNNNSTANSSVDISGQYYLPSPHPSPNLRANDRKASTSESKPSIASETGTIKNSSKVSAVATAHVNSHKGSSNNNSNNSSNNVTRRRRRPPFSYASLIAQAILASPSRQLTLRDIYQWLMDRYPSLYRVDDSSWQNTIRHNLSLNKCFCKAPRQPDDITTTSSSSSSSSALSNKGKGGYWCVNPDYLPLFRDGQWQRAADLEPETGRQVAGLLRVRGGVPRKHASSANNNNINDHQMNTYSVSQHTPSPSPPAPFMEDTHTNNGNGMRYVAHRRPSIASSTIASSTMRSPLLSPYRTPATPPMSLSDMEDVHSEPSCHKTPTQKSIQHSFGIRHLLN